MKEDEFFESLSKSVDSETLVKNFDHSAFIFGMIAYICKDMCSIKLIPPSNDNKVKFLITRTGNITLNGIKHEIESMMNKDPIEFLLNHYNITYENNDEDNMTIILTII